MASAEPRWPKIRSPAYSACDPAISHVATPRARYSLDDRAGLPGENNHGSSVTAETSFL